MSVLKWKNTIQARPRDQEKFWRSTAIINGFSSEGFEPVLYCEFTGLNFLLLNN